MHGKANIGLIEGLPGYDSTERIGGFKDGIKGHPGMKVVAEQPGGWDVPGGNKTALDMLQAHPEINVVFAANDFMAEGAYQAAKTLHRNDLAILGSDGDTNAFELINQGGTYKATMSTVPITQGEIAMDIMHQCLTHNWNGFLQGDAGHTRDEGQRAVGAQGLGDALAEAVASVSLANERDGAGRRQTAAGVGGAGRHEGVSGCPRTRRRLASPQDRRGTRPYRGERER